jgi:hypothetical protein
MHPCEQKWSVDGQLRLGIYAIKPIAAVRHYPQKTMHHILLQ